jgi:3-methyladenine DNA glycosylase AlkD
MRKFAREYRSLEPEEALTLLRSSIHEERLLALLILVHQAKVGGELARKVIYGLYLTHSRFVNNWDLVDVSAPEIVGGYLVDKSRKPLDRLAASRLLWERRISIVATGYFIRQGDFADTLRIAERLLRDREDLIHKAAGWMLREVGKREKPTLDRFVHQHVAKMPRTMLRYAIERFPAEERKAILRGELEG